MKKSLPSYCSPTSRLVLAATILCAGVSVANEPVAPEVASVRDRWAEVMYATAPDARGPAFESLAAQAEAMRKAAPTDADALIWEGIVLSSWAGDRGGLGALGLVKRARADFEAAIAIDPQALDGSAYTSLGSLYYQVPGWPLGFGDDDKARELLLAGLGINPDGIDSNYFYADFLKEQGEWVAADAAASKALAAPARPDRPLADSGRRGQLAALKSEIRGHLAAAN